MVNNRILQAPTLTWVKTNILANPSVTNVFINMIIGDPCEVLQQFNAPAAQEVESAVQHCHVMFEQNILHKLDHYASMHSQRPNVVVPRLSNSIGKRSIGDSMMGTVVSTVVDKVIDLI